MRENEPDNLKDSVDNLSETYKLLKEITEEEMSKMTRALNEIFKSLSNQSDELDDSDIYKEMADEIKERKLQRKNNFNNISNKKTYVAKDIKRLNRRSQNR